MLYLPVEENTQNTFPFDWDSEAGVEEIYYVPTLEPVNENLQITAASLRATSIANGKTAVLTIECSGADTPSLKVYDMNGNEVEFKNLTQRSEDSIVTFTATWTVTGARGDILYYTACVLDSNNAYGSNYEVLEVTIK